MSTIQPMIFISHGPPSVMFEDDDYTKSLREFAKKHGSPKAIVCISAHWCSKQNVVITANEKPEIIFDYDGFPKNYYTIQYPCKSSSTVSFQVAKLLKDRKFSNQFDDKRGFDHGVWVPLRLMYPEGNIPIVQLSLPIEMERKQLIELGSVLSQLRKENILVMMSGGIVHNISRFQWKKKKSDPEPWALDFEDWVNINLKSHDLQSFIQLEEFAPEIKNAHPTLEHLLPFYVFLGGKSATDKLVPIYSGVQYGSVSMSSWSFES